MSTRDESCEMQSAYFPARREGQVDDLRSIRVSHKAIGVNYEIK